jgi:hypothetical protein
MTEHIDMNHPGGDPCVDGPSQVRLASCVEPGSAAERVRKVAAEVEESVAFGGERRDRDAEVW